MAEAENVQPEKPKMRGRIGPRWTWDHTFEKPAGTQDMGGWTRGVYTEEQQKRMGVNELGEPVEKNEEKKLVGGLGGMGPRWTWDADFEKPQGEKDMGGWTASVYTDEQKKRLGVSEMGEPREKKEEKKAVKGFGPRWTWDADFEKPLGEKDMGGWTTAVYTEEQQKRMGVNEMGESVEEKKLIGGFGVRGPRWTWDKDFERPAVRKDMGGWVATVYSAEQQQRLGIDEMGCANRLTARAFTEKIYGGLCRKALEAQYESHKAEFIKVFGQELKNLDIMKGDADYDRLLKVDEFMAWARAQDRSHAGVERPWDISKEELADRIFKDVGEEGLTKKEFLQAYAKNKNEFNHVFKVQSIKWGDFRKGDINHDKHLTRDEFLVWASVQDDGAVVVEAKEGAKAAPEENHDKASEADIKALTDAVYGGFGLAAMKAQYEYFTNDFKERFGEEFQNLDFMKGDANYDRLTTREEFFVWVTAQNKDKDGIERPWEMSAEALAEVIFDNKPEGISAKDFGEEYRKHKQTFDTLLKGSLKFTDFRKADADHDRHLTKAEFLKFVVTKQKESLAVKEANEKPLKKDE